MNISTITLSDFVDAEPKPMASMTFNRSGKKTLHYLPNLLTATITFIVEATDIPGPGQPREVVGKQEFVTLEAAIEYFNQF